MSTDKLEEYQVVIRNGQAMGIESLVKTGLLVPADAIAQLQVLIAQGSPVAEEVLLRVTAQQEQSA